MHLNYHGCISASDQWEFNSWKGDEHFPSHALTTVLVGSIPIILWMVDDPMKFHFLLFCFSPFLPFLFLPLLRRDC